MATVKKTIKKARVGAVCGPGDRRGSCTPSSSSTGAFGRSSRTMKTESYKPGKRIRGGNDDEPSSGGTGVKEKPYERDFPGDVAPGGFGAAAKGKKSTRWITDEKGKTKYAGQSKLDPGKNGKKVVKKAKVGTKVVKSKKK